MRSGLIFPCTNPENGGYPPMSAAVNGCEPRLLWIGYQGGANETRQPAIIFEGSSK
ncbi:hypothetical protein EDD52_101294 [Primorskyibacter sedentarius]|uniref:Uncharacterized protein n=1 Tax=Primorskyibacter sedentarius TaxID=745311 RepID=A0A4R3JPX5_9RHOB|nr:hypothetical protein EDD52_101294 [Primorskyibacter sedentarius]